MLTNLLTDTKQHIAIFKDENGPWAQKRHMPRAVGPYQGRCSRQCLGRAVLT